MDPTSSRPPAAFAPGVSSHSVAAPRVHGLDERAVTPDTREELIRGELVIAAPANPEHGDPHLQIDAIIATNVRPGYVGSSDMLTRTGTHSDFATDTSVRRAGIDPNTGERYLEELAFEVVNTQSLSRLTIKAEEMTARGIRRIFAVMPNQNAVLEWDRTAWRSLSLNSEIVDVCLITSVSVRALLDAAEFGSAAVKGLLARNEPALMREFKLSEQRGEQRGKLSGDLAGRRSAVRALAAAAGITLSDDDLQRIEQCTDVATLERWVVNGRTADTVETLLR
jgi:Uma2 family endonuclease